uniref:Uncharacterized protein n=1 Tax=Cucumis melo TaxID=3656 RepID=A0A9I9CTX4_CUCME
MADNGGASEGQLQGLNEEIMQRLENLINARLGRLEQRLQAWERLEVKKQVVRDPKKEEDLK